MTDAVQIIFPPAPLGVQNAIDTVAELRALDSTEVDASTEVLVAAAGFFKYNPSSLATDDGATVVKPTDKTTLQAGRWILVLLSSAANVAFVANDALAVTRSAQAKMGDFINVLDFHDPALGTDITAALENLIYYAFPSLVALWIFIPAGVWTVTRQIIPGRPVLIIGAGLKATILDFHNVAAVNTTMLGCFSVGTNLTLAAYDTAIGTKVEGAAGSSYSSFENLGIKISGTKPAGFSFGLWSAGRIYARNIELTNCGSKIHANGASAPIGIADESEFTNVTSTLSPSHSFWAEGTDANNCTFTALTAYIPAATFSGVFDNSFLGNTYVGCNATGNNVGVSAYLVSGAANRTALIGCYAESDFTGDVWDVCASATIIAPQGTVPAMLSGARNKTFMGSNSAAGFFSNNPINVAATEALAGSIGDGSNAAIRLSAANLAIRGIDQVYYINRGGTGIEITRNGVQIIDIFNGGISVTGRVRTVPVAVASLPAPAAAAAGARMMVTDSNATLTAGIGAIVAAGGANIVPVVSDGTNWRIG